MGYLFYQMKKKDYTVIYAEPVGHSLGTTITRKEYLTCLPKELNTHIEKDFGWGNVWFVLDGHCTLTDDTEMTEDEPLEEYIDPKIRALMLHTGCDEDEISLSDNYSCRFFIREQYSNSSEEYLVYTDREADDALQDCIDSLFNEQSEELVPGCTSPYFDYKRWFNDMCNNMSKGETLAGYDGEEHSIEVDDTTYYIYKN